ncbi:MAG TPA: acyl-CoA dehydrogenase family protein [Roseiarcus sp.]|nr:acyl-CoA dehydrogenase family protein [Roseiarcus sp.]
MAFDRAEIREWLEANCPPEMRQPVRGDEDICWGGRHWAFQSEAQKLWLERMAARGLTVPTWPKPYGGAGLSREDVAILRDEMRRIGARPPLTSFGISMLGPALLKFGNEEQKRLHLNQIARGEIRWCQGYSEPGAGSDLASLRTKAEDRGDHFLINGQKIWTSYADKADWIFCLVRTDPGAKKQQGISFVLIDMATKGVSTKPIVLISGKSPFCETFFDNVEVPKTNLVGALNRGWDIAKYLLTHERGAISGDGLALFDIEALNKAAASAAKASGGKLHDPILRADIARAAIDTYASAATLQRYMEEAAAGGELGARSAVLKYDGAELNKRRLELLMSLAGAEGLTFDGNLGPESDLAQRWLRSKGNSIEGGTSEIMLDIVAKRILELPSE